MKTTKDKKGAFIKAGCEIGDTLISIFGRRGPSVIYDIGACDGLTSIIYSRLFPESRIIAFEPLKANVVELIENLREYRANVDVYQFAIGNSIGIMDMYVSSGEAPGICGWDTGNKSSSILHPKEHLKEHTWCKFDNIEKVQVLPIDSISSIKPPDYVHMDVQGAELDALKGGKKTLRSMKALWIEVANMELYEKQPLKVDISRYLDSIGMRCIKDTCQNKKYGDMLWIRK